MAILTFVIQLSGWWKNIVYLAFKSAYDYIEYPNLS